MTISVAYTGSPTVSTTEWSLPSASITLSDLAVSGIFQLFLDLSTLTATESYKLQIKESAVSAGTQRLLQDVVFSGAQAEPIYVSESLILMHKWDMTLTKLAGTDRVIPFSIRQVA